MANNEWNKPSAPPPPLFLGQKERDFVKQINDELIEKIMGQTLVYYPIDIDNTKFHPLYGEAIIKTFLKPVRVYAVVEWEGTILTSDSPILDKISSVNVHFHKRRLTEDQNLFVNEGDYIFYGKSFYEVTFAGEPRELFGQNVYQIEISTKCQKARSGLFKAV